MNFSNLRKSFMFTLGITISFESAYSIVTDFSLASKAFAIIYIIFATFCFYDSGFLEKIKNLA